MCGPELIKDLRHRHIHPGHMAWFEDAPLIGLLCHVWPYIAILIGAYLFLRFRSCRRCSIHEKDEDSVYFDTSAEYHDSTGKAERETVKPQPSPSCIGLEQVPYVMRRLEERQMVRRSREFYEQMNTRRLVRHFSTDPVPREVIDNVLLTAG